jgi:hypothetical protein
MSTKYRVHRFNLQMIADQSKLEQLLKNQENDTVIVSSNLTWLPATALVDFLVTVGRWAEGKCRV